jgi:type IV secretory pathway VirB2 component (pilin)
MEHTTKELNKASRRHRAAAEKNEKSVRNFRIASTSAMTLAEAVLMTTNAFAAGGNGLATTAQNILTFVQVGGAVVLAIFIALCGLKMASGGREALAEAKGRVAGLIAGGVCLAGASAIKQVIIGFNGFGS